MAPDQVVFVEERSRFRGWWSEALPASLMLLVLFLSPLLYDLLR